MSAPVETWSVKVPVEGSSHLDVVDERGVTVALPFRRSGESRAVYAARAKLIADAPTLKHERDLLLAALLDANRSWTFSEGQQHTHSWHDREDWRERNRAALDIGERSNAS